MPTSNRARPATGHREAWAHFHRLARDLDVESRWFDSVADPVEAMIARALYADLAVVGRSAAGSAESGPAERLVRECGCAVLVMPRGETAHLDVDRVLIAWHPDPPAHRAVRAALPLLRRASRVEVITVEDRIGGAAEGPPALREVRRFLARHAVPTDARRLAGSVRSAGGVLLEHARGTGAGLVVLGAWHHSPLREALLGGVTRDVLRGAAVPVLVAH